MAVLQEKLPFRNSYVQYYRIGNGPTLIIALHGYGEDGRSFSFLENKLCTNYTIIAIDLPFHGGTVWREGFHFTATDLWQIITTIANGYTQPLIILGYSMGGRMALQLLQYFPEQIQKTILIAPDGLHHNKWHYLSTQTRVGNRLFKWAMQHPKPLFVCMEASCKIGLFNKSVFNFAHFYLDDANARKLLYERWTTLRKFQPNHKILKQNIRKYYVPIHLIFGQFDRVITPKYGFQFKKGIASWVSIDIIAAGHQLLKEKNAAVIAAAISK
ncbi:MAG: alpha/beta fold hydrolase [Hydrotalea sp. AMD]|uniref:alpha/beta fold hydrolase n=1 Tax=Hydrotalea sp. AMD TaxID=2501297 RepID=UPI00094486E2|nr:alpha/beta hydrolase [Hydrotalea sp. AMD]RWZ86639.1 MAG: alpha/beta fold hydrolase [Hydrotalea sp. AMD]